MPAFYPPVLEAKARAIPFISNPENTDFFQIEFEMPSINVLTDIGHIQVSIKYQSTNESAVNPQYSPDRAVLYIKRSEGSVYFIRKESGNYVIQIPYRCFAGGRPQKGVTYIVQVRFANNGLWDPSSNGIDGLGDVAAFAAWRNQATNQVPSAFGEWSNLQTVYCYGEATESLTYNLYDFVPELVYNYAPTLDDPLEQCKIVYQYVDMYGSRIGTMVYNGQYQQDGSYTMKAKLPIAPVQTIYVSVEAVTKNNTIRGQTLTIFPLKNTHEIESLNGEMVDADLVGEEKNDGVLAKTITVKGNLRPESTLNLYRSNVYTLETIKVVEKVPITILSAITVKDFSPEMGEDYQYVACLVDAENRVYATAVSVYDWGYTNPGYARLMNMDATVFLTTRQHQLRLQGGVNVSAFKRNTQDAFQNTIGSPYPFYSRNAATNYRTFTLTGVVSLAFDPTATFLRNDTNNGLWWDNDNGSKLVILNRDLYGESQFSLSRQRSHELASEQFERIDQLGTGSERDVFGPLSIYDEYFFRNTKINTGESFTDENIYMERKFREFVMEWLSNGKPKLFRSETEGNMIVMITGASFTPQERTNRMIYSFSATVTEIAEYNLENLLLYDLLPVEIKSTIISNFPTHLKQGDIISNRDYLAIIFYEDKTYEYYLAHPDPNRPTLGEDLERDYRLTYKPGYEYNAFSPKDELEWYVNGGKLDLINKILKKITEYSFIRGDIDYYLYDGLIYQYSSIYNIPDSVHGIPITPIDTSFAVLNAPGIMDDEKTGETLYPFKIYTVSDGQLPDGIILDNHTGIISGTPEWTNVNTPRQPDTITLRVTIAYYNTPTPNFDPDVGEVTQPIIADYTHAEMVIKVGYIYSELIFHPITIAIPIMTIGEQITPIDLNEYVEGGVKFSQLEDTDTDISYLWAQEGLPNGLSINATGFIVGSYTTEQSGGIATISVTDGAGQVKKQDIKFGDGVRQIYFTDSLDFNITYSEVGESIEEVNVSSGVSGGYPSTANGFVAGYEFSAEGLPPGIDIDSKTGIISGIPTAQVPAGTATITATDFGTPRNSSSIEIVYQEVLPPFIFEDSPEWDIRPYPGDQGMNLGLVIDPINLMEEGHEAVTGGLKYSDPPYYRFTSKNLIPDFSIDNYGVITGRASVKSDPREATLIVQDARGKKKEIEIHIVEIISKLSFNPPASADLSIPESYVNYPNAFFIEIPYTWIEGGTPPYKVEVSGLPGGMKGYEKIYSDEQKSYIIEGIPTVAVEAHDAFLTITDTSPEQETVVYRIPVGAVIAKLQWQQGQINIMNMTEDDEITEEVAKANGWRVQGVSGGKPPYTLKVNPDAKFYPMEIHQHEGGEQNANDIWFEGRVTTGVNTNAGLYELVLTDSMGQTVVNHIQIGEVSEGFTLDMLNSLGNVTLIQGKTVITNLKIMEASGGIPPYEYHCGSDISTTPFDPGIILNTAQGTISGTPQNEATTVVNLQSSFYAYDSGGNNRRRAGASEYWYTPKIVKQPSYTDLVSMEGNQATFNVPILSIDQSYTSGELIKCPLIPWAEWVIDDPSKVPDGLSWNNGIISGQVRGAVDPSDVIFRLNLPQYSPDNLPEIVTPELSYSIKVHFEGVQQSMFLGKPDGIDYDFFEKNVAIEEKNVAEKLTGGVGPYTWTISNNPSGITLSTTETQSRTDPVMIRGAASNGQTTQFQIDIKVEDSIGNTSHYTIVVNGVFDPLNFIDSAAFDIPEQEAEVDIAEINVSTGVSGGSGEYRYTAVDLSPYGIAYETGIISGNSGENSQQAKIATITVADFHNPVLKKSIQISVGAINGKLTFSHTSAIDIPAAAAGTQGTINVAQCVAGGQNLTYEITSLPEGWTETNARFTNASQGVLSYTLPAAGTEAGQIGFTIKDGVSGTTVNGYLNTPAIN